MPNFGDPIALTNGYVSGVFYGAPSQEREEENGTVTQDARLGRMTIALKVDPPEETRERTGAARTIDIQTTVSLRDYENAGLRQ
jgi:hypothetical protein